MNHSSVILTSAAQSDLAEIACYTAKQWGKKKAFAYAGYLDACFEKIASGKALSKPAFPHNDAIQVCRCKHHYVFYLQDDKTNKLIILAILHERMDLMQRLQFRLPK